MTFTKKQLIRELKTHGVIEIGGKTLRKLNKQPLLDYFNENFAIETKEQVVDTIEVVVEETVENEEQTVDIESILSKSEENVAVEKQKAKERKKLVWETRCENLMIAQFLVTDNKWTVPMKELQAILDLPKTSSGKTASVFRNGTDWRYTGGMSAGMTLLRMGYEASLSLRKGKESLTIKKMEETLNAQMLAKYNLSSLV